MIGRAARRISVVLFAGLCAHGPAAAQLSYARLQSLNLANISGGYLSPRAGHSIEGTPLRLNGKTYLQGVGTHTDNVLYIALDGAATRFQATVGVDDEVGTRGTVRFKVWVDKKMRCDSGVMRGGDRPKRFSVDLHGARQLVLVSGSAGDGISYDHADWADAAIEYMGGMPRSTPVPKGEPVILTPPAPDAPRINGPKVVGARPGSPFLFTVPVTGLRPMRCEATGLPDGLALDPATGRITGASPARGSYTVALMATNAVGSATRTLRIEIGDAIALTPPMGWNSYYCWSNTTTDATMRAAADAMVGTGLINHGYSYVSVDDGWSVLHGSDDPVLGGAPRAPDGSIRPNRKFPDMRAMTDYIHSRGLKAGIYSSPGPVTCGNFEGSYEHERRDAEQFAAWGFDLLKYDYCSYGNLVDNGNLDNLKRPYAVMGDILAGLDRDIVYNLCQYGLGDVSAWGAEVGGNSWRTTGDMGGPRNLWENMYSIGLGQNGLEQYAGPGHWNDPDYLLLGDVTWWDGGPPKPTSLTYDEQYTYMSLWSLLAAPLFIGGDVTHLDAFTMNLLTNDEVIAINQDALGRQARRVWRNDDLEVWSKDMEDGSKAVGLFNRGEGDTPITLRWSMLNISGAWTVRDAWRQRDDGAFDAAYTATVPRHGVVLLTVRPAAG